MSIYTVHEPRKLTGDPARDAERFEFVRDGFHFWAFVLGPAWMLYRRMWLVLLGYLLVTVALQTALASLGATSGARFTIGVLVALLIGFEAGTLRRWSLRKWRQVGVVVGRNEEDAERRFFDTWTRGMELPPLREPAPSTHPAPALRAPERSTEVIGLFPEPEPRPRP